jgi:hypothetical protein
MRWETHSFSEKRGSDGQTAVRVSVLFQWQPSLSCGCAEAMTIVDRDLNQTLESSKEENWLALWTFSPQPSNRRRRLKEKLSWGCLAPCPGLLPCSQHPVISGIPRLGLPVNVLPLLPAPLISLKDWRERKAEATENLWSHQWEANLHLHRDLIF